MISRLLGGKVWWRSLPVFSNPPGPSGPVTKRLVLPQGELAQFYDGEEAIRYIAAIELKPGSVRGNHYHQVKQEWMYLIHGEVLLLVGEVSSTARDSVVLKAGDLAFVPAGVAHALRPISAGLAVEFSPTPFDPADTCQFSL